MANILLIAAITGMLTPIFSGYANAQDVQQLIQQSQRTEKRDLENSLYDAVKEGCIAMQTGNLPLAQVKERTIRDMEGQYLDLQAPSNNQPRQRYRRPDCSLFVQQGTPLRNP